MDRTGMDPTTTDLILRRQLLAAGYDDRHIARMVGSGEWVRLRRGAFAHATTWNQLSRERQHALLGLAVARQAKVPVVLSHVSALPAYGAPLWGLDTRTVHVTRRDARAGRAEAGVRQHKGRLLPGDVREDRDPPVTSATRTALDVTTVARTEAALCVVKHLLHLGLTDPVALRARQASMDKNPFTLRTDLVLRLADGRIETVGESRSFHLFWRFGLPCPVPQWSVVDRHGAEVARLDFAWPELGVWLEFDGRQKYGRLLRPGQDPGDVVFAEKQREDLVRELTGWRCIRITWDDLAHPERTAQRILAMLFPATRAS